MVLKLVLNQFSGRYISAESSSRVGVTITIFIKFLYIIIIIIHFSTMVVYIG